MKKGRRIRKTQKIHINHFGENSNSDILTIFTTVREYPKILDSFTANAVKEALDYLNMTFAVEKFITHSGVSVQVILVD